MRNVSHSAHPCKTPDSPPTNGGFKSVNPWQSTPRVFGPKSLRDSRMRNTECGIRNSIDSAFGSACRQPPGPSGPVCSVGSASPLRLRRLKQATLHPVAPGLFCSVGSASPLRLHRLTQATLHPVAPGLFCSVGSVSPLRLRCLTQATLRPVLRDFHCATHFRLRPQRRQ